MKAYTIQGYNIHTVELQVRVVFNLMNVEIITYFSIAR